MGRSSENREGHQGAGGHQRGERLSEGGRSSEERS